MSRQYAELLQDHIDIAAPPSRVWALVSDVRRMPEWSPQVSSVRLRAGVDRVELGARFTNLNHHGDLAWTTHGEIIAFAPDDHIAFRVEENRAIWSFSVEEHEPGHTRLVQRRKTPDGISDYSLDLTDRHLGGQEVFTEVLRDGMRQTLERIRSAVETASAA